MTLYECAKRVQSCGIQLIRSRKDAPADYDCKNWEGNKRGWYFLDATTASAIVAVREALRPDHQSHFDALPLQKAVTVCWKLVK